MMSHNWSSRHLSLMIRITSVYSCHSEHLMWLQVMHTMTFIVNYVNIKQWYCVEYIRVLLFLLPAKRHGNSFSSCMSVCIYNDFQKSWQRKFVFGCSFMLKGHGSSSHMKVIGSRSQEQKMRKSVFLQCKISIGNNSSSIKYRAIKFVCSMGFLQQIKWWDCHL